MLRSMYSGISGMKNFQTKLDVIGNNIANVNTFGFKKGRVTFKDTMNQTISGASGAQSTRGGRNPMQVGLGSTVASVDTVMTQSSMQTTGRSLDLAVSGDGYFVVKQGNAQLYTRAGNFYLDNNGTLVNGDGMKVQSYKNGQLQDITVNVNSILPAKQTSNINFSGNLPSDATGNSNLIQQIKVVDSNGSEHVLDMKITPVSPSTGVWHVKLVDNSSATPLDTDLGDVTIPAANKTNQTININSVNGGPTTIANVNIALSGLTKNAGNLDATAVPDGNSSGSLESFNIGASGEINGVFSNGLVLQLGQLALAKFSNPSGLTKTGANLFQDSSNSGTANINVAGNGRGTIASGSLEMSNVDLSEEFTEMITAQRGFQANTKIITTSDEILQELVNLKR